MVSAVDKYNSIFTEHNNEIFFLMVEIHKTFQKAVSSPWKQHGVHSNRLGKNDVRDALIPRFSIYTSVYYVACDTDDKPRRLSGSSAHTLRRVCSVL